MHGRGNGWSVVGAEPPKDRDSPNVNGVPHPFASGMCNQGKTVRALRWPGPRRAFLFLRLAPPRRGGAEASARSCITSAAWRRRYVGATAWSRRYIAPAGRRRIGASRWPTIIGGSGNGGRGRAQVRCCAGCARIIARRCAGWSASAGRLAIIGRWRRIIIVPTPAENTRHYYGNCQESHVPLL
jgi:hypothetical protein